MGITGPGGLEQDAKHLPASDAAELIGPAGEGCGNRAFTQRKAAQVAHSARWIGVRWVIGAAMAGNIAHGVMEYRSTEVLARRIRREKGKVHSDLCVNFKMQTYVVIQKLPLIGLLNRLYLVF